MADGSPAGTKERPPKTSKWHFPGFYVTLCFCFLFVMGFEAWLSRRPLAEAVIPELTDFEKKQIDTFVEINKLLTTLATGLIAAITGFLINRDQKVTLVAADFYRATASWITAALSLYFGHLAYRQMLWMLHNHFFNIFYDAVWVPSRIQFWLFLLSTILLADFIHRSFRTAGTDALTQNH